ncbi:multi antimicrobial extrusion protein [Desulfoluna butyratoxydans]|uniref:Multidrug-efflux transporter n=2 Tax=Desulfoluna butyratoxydans TaxID=231438 RepID=A0A4U8YYH9_9BACT|nr:multi antimicrobial extrusion protein [Desulfoluna butyratoxydans]
MLHAVTFIILVVMFMTLPARTSNSHGAPRSRKAEAFSIARLALPIILSQLSVAAAGFIDTMMAGHYSSNALAGAAVGGSLCFPFIIAMNGLMMAVTPITAQLTGAGRKGESGRVVRQALWLALFFSLLLFVGIRHMDPVLALMKTTDEVVPIIKGYLEGISFGFPAIAGYFVLKSYAEGIGRTKPQMIISLLTVPFNYVANDILIYGKFGLPALGGAGCGWASGLTFWLFFLLMLLYTLSSETCREGKPFAEFSLPSPAGMGELLALGLPIAGTIFMECSIFACITLFLGALGPVVVGGHQVALNFSGLVFSIPLSIGMALTIRAGHAVGARDPEGARYSCFTGCMMAMVVSLFTLSFTLGFAREIVAVYTRDPDVTAVAVDLLFLAALYQVSDSVMTTSQGALRGYKDAKVTFILTFTAYWVITLPLGYTLSMTDALVPAMGARGFWLSLIAGLTVSGLFLGVRLVMVSGRAVAAGRACRAADDAGEGRLAA